ncbi:MAG: DUF3172 domain-containing protein [Cyanobacteria bacterium SW_9_44_58]|nr:MAG: DUF3172 domain-containing protein [Cyanobacteria bacterium SW_9_44_58]
MARKTTRAQTSSRRYYDEPPRSSNSSSSQFNLNPTYWAIIGAVFIIGIGLGMVFSSATNLNSENLTSTVAIDRSVPNPEFCAQYGASAVVTDMRVYMSLNPFSVYVTQPKMVPGCVMRRTNWSVLEDQNLVSREQVRDCKNRMNTFAFTGKLEESPEIHCVYQNDSAGKFFRNNSGGGLVPSPERDDF